MTFTVRIEKVVFGGYGLGFSEDKTCFVLNAFPDDIVQVKVLNTKKNSYFCEIDKIIQPSPYRGQTRCELSNKCGACDWVNVEYDKQIKLKTQIYNEIFDNKVSAKHTANSPLEMSGREADGVFCRNLQVDKSPVVDHYRNKNLFPVKLQNNKVAIGMYIKNTHTIVEHEHCFLYPSYFKNIVNSVKEWIEVAKVEPYDEITGKGVLRHIGIRCSSDFKSNIVILVTRTRKLPFTKQFVNSLLNAFPEIVGIVQNINASFGNTILGDDTKVLYGNPYLTEIIGKKRFQIHYQAFFQINVLQAVNVYRDIASFINEGEVVIDAYSGIGVIGIFIADKAKKVICIEENVDAIASGMLNSKINGIDNIIFSNNKTETVIEKLIDECGVDTVVFDPPRKGLEKSIIHVVARKNIKKVIYMSCNPTTQKRDIQSFLEHGYKLMCLKGYDMFPHTWHIESLAVLMKE